MVQRQERGSSHILPFVDSLRGCGHHLHLQFCQLPPAHPPLHIPSCIFLSSGPSAPIALRWEMPASLHVSKQQ